MLSFDLNKKKENNMFFITSESMKDIKQNLSVCALFTTNSITDISKQKKNRINQIKRYSY